MDIIKPSSYGFTIYSKSNCKYCIKIKSLFTEFTEFTENTLNIIDCNDYLSENKVFFLDFIKNLALKEVLTFPIVFFNGNYIGGYNETKKMMEEQFKCPESNIYYDVIPSTDMLIDFYSIKDEIVFYQVTNQGSSIPRLIAIQCSEYKVDDVLLKPIYRHPIDIQPNIVSWTPNVLAIKNYLSKKFNQNLNHCLIQLYRDGNDSIGEHSDKTLDIKYNSNIINFSIGATRVMHIRLKEKKEDKMQIKIPLKHNSAYLLDWSTNQQYLHGIRPDKRQDKEKTIDEKAYNGERISFTFRTIDTFIDSNNKLYGQGAKKYQETYLLKSDYEESLSLINAFSIENKNSTLNWYDIYGEGYDVINFQILNDKSNN